MYEVRFSKGVAVELKRLRAGSRRRILDKVQQQLAHQPTATTKHIKRLRNFVPPFEAVPPIWQLRVGDYRVFYDVDERSQRVFIRAVRRKPPHLTTEEIL